MTQDDATHSGADRVGGPARPHAPTHPHLAASLLMIGIVVFLLAASVISVL
jgi:hypothetical protein